MGKGSQLANALTNFQEVSDLPGETVLLSACFVSQSVDFQTFEAAGFHLPEELKRAVPKRQAEYLAGRLLASQACARLGVEDTPVPRGEGGLPVWPSGVMGSISHTDGRVACLLSRSRDLWIGVDIEHRLAPSDLEATARLFLTPDELERLQALSEDKATLLATLSFSAKETLYKALYPTVRSYFGFDCAQVVGVPGPDYVTLVLTCELHPDLPGGRCFQVGYRLDSDVIMTWLVAEKNRGV